MLTPGSPVDFPGIERVLPVRATVTSVTSASWTVQLPAQGTWMLMAQAWYTNNNNSVARPFIVHWEQTVSAKTLAAAWPLGAIAKSSDAGASDWATLDFSAPSATGLITVTGTWTSAVSRPAVYLITTGFRMQQAGALDLT